MLGETGPDLNDGHFLVAEVEQILDVADLPAGPLQGLSLLGVHHLFLLVTFLPLLSALAPPASGGTRASPGSHRVAATGADSRPPAWPPSPPEALPASP